MVLYRIENCTERLNEMNDDVQGFVETPARLSVAG